MDRESQLARRRLLRQFEVVAYGCHERARRLIRRELEGLGFATTTFLFVEYFCLRPIAIVEPDAWKHSDVFFPYIRRIVEESLFIWVPDERGVLRLQPKSAAILREFALHERFVLPGRETEVGTRVFTDWRSKSPLPARDRDALLYCQSVSPEEWEEKLREIERKSVKGDDCDALLREFGLIGAAWKESRHPCVLYAFPISSDAVFYGYFLLIIPDQPGAPKAKGPLSLDACVGRLFATICDTIYLPVLTLLYESLLEAELYEIITKNSDPQVETDPRSEAKSEEAVAQDAAAFLQDKKKVLFLNEPGSASVPKLVYSRMEDALHTLWRNRGKLFEEEIQTGRFCSELKETLLFSRYYVASPGMVSAVREVMERSGQLKPPRSPGDELPSALVFGLPGSGKDTLARMIHLFSSSYFEGPVYTVNMSALKPDFLTGPLFQGVTIGNIYPPQPSEVDTARRSWTLDGILWAATQAPKGTNSTFILDELNSLDVDLQGILLRILEQGEVTPLLGIERRHVSHLIIGIVNENPEEISRETQIRELLVDKGKFGSLLSGLLYEVVRRSRRLRHDLYHRLRRKLFVTLPDIDNRREDIPLLFYREITREPVCKDYGVDLRAYRLLMSPQISWVGNIRQIQSVAKRAARHVGETESQDVSYECVLRALEEEFDLRDKIDDVY